MEQRIVVGAYGAILEIAAPDAEFLNELLQGLPRGWTAATDVRGKQWRFVARRTHDVVVTVNGAGVEAHWPDVDGARAALREELRRYVGFHTPDLFFVHAGVVAYRDAVIVLPGRSFAGKSTLVRALVAGGAEFYSDEYAIIDRTGHVIQYREPLIARGPNGREETEIVAEGPDRPLPVGLVVVTSYRERATWAPREVSVADGIVAMAEHVSRARPRAADTFATLKLALKDATVLVGERGDADETATALLATATHLAAISGGSG